MSARTLRTLAVAAGAAALVVSAAAPAMAAQTVTSLPGKVTVAKNEVVTVTIANPANFTCAQAASAGAVGWSTRVVGQKAGIASVSNVTCNGDNTATWTVTAANLDVKKNAVVKFIATTTAATDTADAVKSVSTLVVKLNPTAKPGKGHKPA